MDEIAFYNCITGEWICSLKEKNLIFKYDGFHIYKRENQDWVQTYEWSLVRLSENTEEVTGILFNFLNLPELLLQSFNDTEQSLDFIDMLPAHETYHFEKFIEK